MNSTKLSESEMVSLKPGEAITVTAVMGILVIAVVSIIVYRLFRSETANIKLPGGWQFSWK